jgi:biopolymer transport protein ExbB
MNRSTLTWPRLTLLALGIAAAGVRGEETFDAALQRTAQNYADRLQQAGKELNETRARIAQEKAPLLARMRRAEDRILSADQETLQMETAANHVQGVRRSLLKTAELLYKNTTYINTVAQEGLKAFGDGLAPGEAQRVSDPLLALQTKLGDPASNVDAKTAVDVAEFLFQQIELSTGGYAAAGSAQRATDNQIVPGRFAFTGPQTYFRSDDGTVTGIVTRGPEGTPYPIVYALPAWSPDAASAFFQGRVSTVPSDATDGKALRLKQTKGSLRDHIDKGGVVAYVIVCVGLVALVLIVQKAFDLVRMSVDRPEVVQDFLKVVARGRADEARQALGSLRGSTRELYQVGLDFRDQPKVVLEERLEAVLLRQRLHYERRLPLLAVIATAAPLMGLLGTVVGMVRTFALITVFGTGNAGKLASGISEVLVATELGLTVAIPTLVAHGFLTHRIQKNLSLLERYALEFVTATRTGETDSAVAAQASTPA